MLVVLRRHRGFSLRVVWAALLGCPPGQTESELQVATFEPTPHQRNNNSQDTYWCQAFRVLGQLRFLWAVGGRYIKTNIANFLTEAVAEPE